MTYNLSTCTTNVDCHPYETNRLCVAGATWLQPDEDECQCGGFFGRIGDNCDELTVASIASVVLYSTIVLAAFVSSMHASQLLRVRLQHRPVVSQQSRRRSARKLTRSRVRSLCGIFRALGPNLAAADAALLLFILTEFSSVALGCLTIANFVVTSGVPPEWMQEKNEARYQAIVRLVAYPAFGTFTTFLQLHICLMWVEIAELVLCGNEEGSAGLLFFRRLVIRTQIVMLTAFAGCIVLQAVVGINLLPLVASLSTLLCLVLYTIGANKMNECATLMAGADKTMQTTINQLRDDVVSTVKYARTSNGVCAVSSLVFLVTASRKDLMQPGNFFNVIRISHHGIFLSLNIVHLSVYRFIYLRSRRYLARKSAKRGMGFPTLNSSKHRTLPSSSALSNNNNGATPVAAPNGLFESSVAPAG